MFRIANILQPLIDVADVALGFFHDSAGLSWGLSIIALTVVVRILILPLTFKQVRAMQDLQRLQPEIKKLQERYKGDRQRMNQEMMGFYQEHKVNPLGSCLPILLQIPVFITLFYLLRSDEFQREIRGEESFLFITDLAEPATGTVLIVLLVLYVGSQLGSTLVTAISADKNQRRLFLALPFVFVVFVWQFQAGLLVYWITTNVWTVGQQLLVKRLFPPPAPLSAGVADAALGKTAAGTVDGSAPAKGARGRSGKLAPAFNDGSSGGANGGPAKAPPPSPRKKKRSGRRR